MVTLTRPSIVPGGGAPVEAQEAGYVKVPPVAPEWQPVAKAIRATGIADLIAVEPAEGGTLLRVRFRAGVGFDERKRFDLWALLAGVLGGRQIRAAVPLMGAGDNMVVLVEP